MFVPFALCNIIKKQSYFMKGFRERRLTIDDLVIQS